MVNEVDRRRVARARARTLLERASARHAAALESHEAGQGSCIVPDRDDLLVEEIAAALDGDLTEVDEGVLATATQVAQDAKVEARMIAAQRSGDFGRPLALAVPRPVGAREEEGLVAENAHLHVLLDEVEHLVSVQAASGPDGPQAFFLAQLERILEQRPSGFGDEQPQHPL